MRLAVISLGEESPSGEREIVEAYAEALCDVYGYPAPDAVEYARQEMGATVGYDMRILTGPLIETAAVRDHIRLQVATTGRG